MENKLLESRYFKITYKNIEYGIRTHIYPDQSISFVTPNLDLNSTRISSIPLDEKNALAYIEGYITGLRLDYSKYLDIIRDKKMEIILKPDEKVSTTWLKEKIFPYVSRNSVQNVYKTKWSSFEFYVCDLMENHSFDQCVGAIIFNDKLIYKVYHEKMDEIINSLNKFFNSIYFEMTQLNWDCKIIKQ